MTIVARFSFLYFGLSVGCTSPSDSASNKQANNEEENRFCAEAGSVTSTSDGFWLAETAHYQLYAQTTAEETAILSAMLDASWLAMTNWFEAVPEIDTPFRVELYADYNGWTEAIAADGLEVPVSAGGYYHPSTRTAYLYIQPTLYYTRQLLLHEAIHQFHHHIRSEDHPLPGWYVEGIAEYLSLYDWDGECIELGRLPLLTQEDRPAEALTQSAVFDLNTHFSSQNSIDRSIEWAMFRYFDTAEGGLFQEQWKQFQMAMEQSVIDPISEFESIFGEPPSQFNTRIQDWLSNEQQPLQPLYLEWLHQSPTSLSGWSEYFSIAPLKQSPNRFAITVEEPSSSYWAGGVLLSFQDSSNWIALVVDSDTRIQTFEVINDEALWWDQGTAPAAQNGEYRFEIEHTNSESIIHINGTELILPLLFTASGGPAINNCYVQFRDISWE